MPNNSQNAGYLTKQIGSTLYYVKVLCNPDSHQTMEDKLHRIIRNSSELVG